MSFTRSILRLIARGLIGAMLFGQLAIAAYACPTWTSDGARANQGSAVSTPSAVAQDSTIPDCDDSMGVTDPQWSNLCAEHCKAGDQSDHARSVVVPLPWLHALYASPRLPLRDPGRRPMAAPVSALVAAAPPHAIVHCVLRT
jgi:hypothetical protein